MFTSELHKHITALSHTHTQAHGGLTEVKDLNPSSTTAVPFFYSPKHTVSGKRITISGTVTGTAAVFMKAPVSHHAPVAVGSTHSGFADAVSIGGVAECTVGQVEGHGAHRVTAAC